MQDWVVLYLKDDQTIGVSECETRFEAHQFARDISDKYPSVYVRDRGCPFMEKIIVVEKNPEGDWHAMFKRNPPDVRGCPMGRDITAPAAVNDLITRTNWESKLSLRTDQFIINIKED